MRPLSFLLPAVVVLLFCAHSHAACTGVTSGMTEAQVVSAINACSSAGGGSVNFGAGVYGPFTSNFSLPCNVSLSGPVVAYSQTHNQTAILRGSASFIGQPLQTAAGCSNHQTIQYLEWNGEQPTVTGGGGGFIQVSAGTQNLTVQNNWIHGMNAPSSDTYGDQNTQANGIYFCCGTGSPVTQSVAITHNEFGSESYSDCGGAMEEQQTENGGGFCNGVGVHTNTANVSVDHNIFHYLEQGAKYYEDSGYCNPFTMSYNSFSYIQRIPYETQCNAGTSSAPTLMYIQYNYFGNRYNGNGGQQNYDISAANGCGNGAGGYCITHTDYNVDVQNINNSVHGAGYEIWGQQGTTANYNLWEGYVAGAGGAIDWSQNGSFTFDNNTFNIVGGSNTSCTASTGGYLNHEQSGTAYTPACAGNAFSNAGTGTYASAAPSISPGGGQFSGAQAITLTNTGANRDLNTSIWYTTNGSTPVPGANGTSLYTGPFSITSTTTINALGMWGAQNQPTSYPTGVGYVPSGIVRAIYTASGVAPVTPVPPTTPVPPVAPTTPVAPGSPILNSAYLGTPNNVNTMVVGGTLQFAAMGMYGTSTTPVPIPASQVVWSSSNPAVLTVEATGKVTAVGVGKASVQDQIGTVTGSAWTITNTGRVIKSAYVGPPSGAKTMTIGSTMQLTAFVTYSDGTSGTLPDASGNVVTSWNTTNHKVAVISSGGQATALSQGSINMEAMVGTFVPSPWPVTVAAVAPPAAGPAAVPAAPGAALADTFLGPFWRLETPVGGSASISNSHLFLGVPGGANHDPLLPSNQAVRVVQMIGSENFDVAIKIDSPLFATDGNTSQGLMILSKSEDFITFALTTDGTKIGLNALRVTGGAATTVLDDTDFSQYQNPMYLRISKAGSAYVAFYSVDGASWTQVASFTDATTFSSIGPFASNYSSTPANAAPVVMSVNWFDVQQ
jgi:Chitobiase/beta-hexosaminidase C-terminal domain/Bacterial Ig-like domain (group 2)